MRVFISHSRDGLELARDIARRLSKAGHVIQGLESNVPTSVDWKRYLRDQIRQADAVMLLATPGALTSPWMAFELGMADGFDKVVLPVIAGVDPASLPSPLRSYQTVPYDHLDEAIEGLARGLGQEK